MAGEVLHPSKADIPPPRDAGVMNIAVITLREAGAFTSPWMTASLQRLASKPKLAMEPFFSGELKRAGIVQMVRFVGSISYNQQPPPVSQFPPDSCALGIFLAKNPSRRRVPLALAMRFIARPSSLWPDNAANHASRPEPAPVPSAGYGGLSPAGRDAAAPTGPP